MTISKHKHEKNTENEYGEESKLAQECLTTQWDTFLAVDRNKKYLLSYLCGQLTTTYASEGEVVPTQG